MDASTLEREIRSLDIRSESLEGWLTFWIILVVIGLVIEVFVVLKDHLHISVATDRRSLGELFLVLCGPLLITIGVAGELGIHVKAGKVNTDLRTANKKLVGLFSKDAGDARREAGNANERAGNAIERAGKADQRSRKLETSNLQLRKDLSMTETRLAAEQIKLQKEQQINIALTRRAFGRQANPELFKELKNFPKARVEVWYKHDDGEASRFAASIVQLLGPTKDGGMGWDVPPPIPRPQKGGEPPLVGTRIYGRRIPVAAEMFSPHPTSVYVLLSRAVGAGSGWYDTALPENSFRIEIGQSVFPYDELLQGPILPDP
jgi:hypothetical protein